MLCLFSKQQNKWYVHWYNECVPFEPGMKKYKMLVMMVTNEPGSEMKEVDLEKGEKWGPKFVFSMRYVGDIMRIEGKLGSSYD